MTDKLEGLWPHQRALVKDISESQLTDFNGLRRYSLRLPVGTGKTLADYCERDVTLSQRMYEHFDARYLAEQTRRREHARRVLAFLAELRQSLAGMRLAGPDDWDRLRIITAAYYRRDWWSSSHHPKRKRRRLQTRAIRLQQRDAEEIRQGKRRPYDGFVP